MQEELITDEQVARLVKLKAAELELSPKIIKQLEFIAGREIRSKKRRHR